MARWTGHCDQSQACCWHQAFTLGQHWVRGVRSHSPGDSQGGGERVPLPAARLGWLCLSVPWHRTLQWGPHGKRIFLGQLRYGLSSFHLPNYET